MAEDIEMNVEQYVNTAKDASTASEQSYGQDRLLFPMSPTAQYPSGSYANPDGFYYGSGAVLRPAWGVHLSGAEARSQAFPPDRKVEGGLLPNLTGVKEAEVPQPGPRQMVTSQKESYPAEAQYEIIPMTAPRAPLPPPYGYEHQQRPLMGPNLAQVYPYGPRQPYFQAQQPVPHQGGLHYPPPLAGAFQQPYPAQPGVYYPYQLQYQPPGNIVYPYPVLPTTRMTGPNVGHVLAASGFKGPPADPGPPDDTAGTGRLGSFHDRSTPGPPCWPPTNQAAAAKTDRHRKSVIAGQEVEVRPPTAGQARSMYRDRLLFQGLPFRWTTEEVTNYLETVSGCAVKELLYGDEDSIVMAAFEGEPDSDSVTSKCLEKKIEGKVVGVTRVPMTNCILVENLPSDITQDLLTLYFENTKRSGGGDVQRVEMFQGQNKCLIFFTEAQTASSVSAKTGHKLSKRDLKVRLYFECLGHGGGMANPSVFDMPADVILDAGHMASFLRQQLKRFDQLARALQGLHADPTLMDTSIVITCTLSAAVTGARSLAKKWSAEVRQAVKAFLDSFTTKEIEVKTKLRHKVEEAVKRGLTNSEASNVVFEPQGSLHLFRIVETPSEVLSIENKICQIIEAADKEFETEKLTGEDFIELQNHPYKLRLLKAMNLPRIVASKYEHLHVMFHDQKVLLRGCHNDVKEGKMEILQILNSLELKQEIFSAEAVKLLEDFHTDEYVSRKMASNQITAVWQIQQESVVCVYAPKEDEANRAMNLIKQAIYRVKLDLTEEAAMFQQGHEFRSHVQTLQTQYPGVLLLSATEDGRSLIITATDNIAQLLVKQVQEFLENNTIYTQEIRVSPTRYKFLTSSWQSKLNQIVSSLQREKVQLLFNDEPAFIACGNESGLMMLATEMTSLVEMIVVHEEILTDKDKLIFMKTGKSEAKLDKLCLTHRCAVGYEWETPGLRIQKKGVDNLNAEVVEVSYPVVDANLNQVKNPEVTSKPVSDADTVPRAASVQSPAIVIVSGEIAQQQVDVIVNSTSNNLDLKSGAISASILRVAGNALLAECLESYPNGIRPGQIATTKGHGLKCKEVYHVTLHSWDAASSQEMLQKTVYECLTKCSESGHASIAFPALGTGVLAYPRDIVAQTLMGAVSQFRGRRQSSTPLREVRVVVYHKDAATLEAFELANKAGNAQPFRPPTKNPEVAPVPPIAVAPSVKKSQGTSPSPITVQMVPGEIAGEKVDVIVNSTSTDLDLKSGAISSSILQAAGQGLQDEVKKLYPGGIAGGKIAITRGHNLQCQKVYHVTLPSWSGATSTQALYKTVQDCLDTCSRDGLTSIAFPALGTGNLSYPKDEVAKTMMGAVRDFGQKNPFTKMKVVRMVIYHKDSATLEAFQQVNNQRLTTSPAVPGTNNQQVNNQRLTTSPAVPGTNNQQVNNQRLTTSPAVPGTNNQQVNNQRLTTSPAVPASATAQPAAAATFQNQSTARSPSSSQSTGRLTVSIIYGEIAMQAVDVIVNSTGNDLDLTNGAISSSILKVAGQRLQDEVNKTYPQGLKDGEMATSKGHGLKCRQVFHLCLSDWTGVSSKQALQQATEQVLSKCQAKNYRTVAIPALGTGKLGYPCDQVAEAMMTATHRFDQANPSSSLREVTFVVYFQDMHIHREFQRVYSQLFSSSSSVTASLPGKRFNRTFSDSGRSHKGNLAAAPAEIGDRKSSAAVDWECDIKGLRLVVRPGDVTEAEADALINTVNNSLELRGHLGESLKKKCGKPLEEELLSKKADMTNSGIVATKGYNLRFRVIFHLNGDKKKGWKGLKTALDEAERHRVTSLALAPIGDNICTNKGMEKFAEDLVMAVTKFTTRNHVQMIQVVVLDDVLIAPFTTDLQTRIQRSKAGRVLDKFFKAFGKEDKNEATPASSSDLPEKSITESRPQRQESGTSDKSKLYIYAESQMVVDRFLRAFEGLVKENVVSQEIEERTMQDLTPAQKQKIREIADKYKVEIQIDPALGRYKLHGYVQSVAHAQKDITEVVREAERHLQEREKETLLADVVQWAFLERVSTGTQLVEYQPKENMIIDKAFKNKAHTAELVDVEGKVYVVDFDSMLEYPKGNESPDESVQVLRKIKDFDSSSGIRLPLEWSLHPKDEAVMVVSLKATDKEYADVEGNLRATLSQTSLTILSIDRIQNRPLYQQYAVKKAHMDKQNGPGFVNEKILWHGTASEAIQNINNHGFNRSYCGKNATVYGDGVYFALESSYSTQKTYSPPDSSGHRYLYQCQVLVGHPVRGKQGMRFLPSRKGLVMFDSATNNVSDPSMYVIFNDTQAYPQYLIKFK